MNRHDTLSRIAGAMLALGTLTYLVTITLYMTIYGAPSVPGEGTVTLADRAAHYLDNQDIAHAIWNAEILASLFLAFAGFGLAVGDREDGGHGAAGSGWLLVGIGGTLMLVMFPFMLGGYPEAARAVNDTPAVMAVLQDSVLLIFYLSNFVVFLGLGVALFAERVSGGAVYRWMVNIGGLLSLYSGAVFLGLTFGTGSLALAGPTSLLAYLLAAVFGLRVAVRG